MKKMLRDKRGQFVIIAVLMIAIMIISIGALMHRAVTYYKHEPWEEYLALIGNIELNSKRLVELSLANYSHTLNQSILKINLERWKADISNIYVGRGASLSYELANRSYNVDGTSVKYLFGLNYSWFRPKSFTAANATFMLNITAIGLTGYKFTVLAFLNLTILNVTTNNITVTVKAEDKMPVAGLEKENFQVKFGNTAISIVSVKSCYDSKEALIYIIECAQNISTPVTVEVSDLRGIKVVAQYP
jgi:hypothetical protein